MIVFELICAERHRFEGWFASGEEFGAQKKRRLISCPLCGSDSVEKLPSARIRTGDAADSRRAAKPGPQSGQSQDLQGRAALNELMNYVLLNTEDVGGRFAQEARRMHQEETPRRGIRGTATHEEAKGMVEEGIPIVPLPIPPRDEWH